MLSSLAEDAVREAWLRLARSDEGAIGNLGGWRTLAGLAFEEWLDQQQLRRPVSAAIQC